MKSHFRDNRRGRSSYGTQGVSQTSQGGRQSQTQAAPSGAPHGASYGTNNYNIHQQQISGTYGGQEQSVERLKSCIADLKKLATSKVKKTSSGMQNSNSNLHSQSNLYEPHGQYEKYDPRYAGAPNVAQQVPYTHTNAGNGAMGYAHGNAMRGSSQSSGQMKPASNNLQQHAYNHGGSHHAGSSSFSNMRSGSQPQYQSFSKHPGQNLSKKPSKDNLQRDQRGRPSDRYNHGGAKGGFSSGHYQSQKAGHQYAQMPTQSNQDHRQGKGQNNNKIQNALKKYMNDIGESQVVSPPNASNINFQKYGSGGHPQKVDNRGSNYSHAAIDSGAHNQPRSATTKKPRPQSGKPSHADKHGQHVIQTHVINQQNPRGGSLKRELYNSNQNQLSLQGSTHKYGQKGSKLGIGPAANTGSGQPGQSAQFSGASGFNSVHGQGPQKQNSISKMKPHHIGQNTSGNIKHDAGRGSSGGLQQMAPQRKAQSVDPRDRAAAAFSHSGTALTNSRNANGQQSTTTNNIQSFGPTHSTTQYRPDQKSSTQNFSQRHDSRPQSGYIASVQPRSNSTSYLQKQTHFHSNAHYNQYDQNGHRTNQPRGNSVNDLAKGTKSSAYPSQASSKETTQTVINKYQQEFQKYQNYQKVLSDRPGINDSNYRPSSTNQRQSSNSNATQGFNPTASSANHKSKQNGDTRLSHRASQDTQGQSSQKYPYETGSNTAVQRSQSIQKEGAKGQQPPDATSPSFRQQPKYQAHGSSQKQEIMKEFANDSSQFKTQQQQMLESYNRAKVKTSNRAQHSQRDKQQLSQRGSALSKRESNQQTVPMGPEVRREVPLMPNQSQTGTYSQSHSQMSMMGANVSNDFKDGQTNIVQNLQVNLSPTSQNATKNSFKNQSQQNESSQGPMNFSIANFKNNNTSSSLAAQEKSKGSQSFDVGQQQQPPQMGGGRAPIHTQQFNNSQFHNSKGSLPKGSTAQYMQPNTIYSLQQANGGNYNSLSLNNGGQYLGGMTGPGGNHTLNYLHSNARTLMVTKEDFNIEDIHVQMVFKIQREKKILQEIEGDPSGKAMDTSDLTTHQVDENIKEPQLVELLDQEEILGNDMCKEPAINWGRGRPPLQPVVLAMQQSNAHPSNQPIHYVDNPNRFSNQHPQKGPGPAAHIPSVNNFVGGYAGPKMPKNLSHQEQQNLLHQHQQHFEKLQQQYMQQLKAQKQSSSTTSGGGNQSHSQYQQSAQHQRQGSTSASGYSSHQQTQAIQQQYLQASGGGPHGHHQGGHHMSHQGHQQMAAGGPGRSDQQVGRSGSNQRGGGRRHH